MWAAQTIKHAAIRARVYRPARWMKRHLHKAELQAHSDALDLYRDLIPSSALCFDVGANLGAVSEVLLKVGARVVAFEPNPTLLPELHARCSGHPQWTLVSAAVGEAVQIAVLYERAAHGQSSLDAAWEGTVIRTHYVPVITLDAAVRRFGEPYYCKIDVEGYEQQVLRGLSVPVPLISFEFHDSARNLEATRACLESLHRHGAAVVNVTTAEGFRLLLPVWRPLGEVLREFPDSIRAPVGNAPYGDLWVRMTS